MQIYEVGGAVRDELLGRQVTERDWLVVGATSEDLLKLGYRRVGKDFPVFLHPETKEEYALARTERKVGPGYTGFTFETAPTITVEQDLERRDLTINAIARDSDGRLVDPWGGQRDITERKLRHVSDAFREDPVRVLRTARFAAQLAAFEFSVAPETEGLMREMVASGEVDALKPERVWKETHKALSTRRPDVFFTVLRHCGALARVFPEVDDLFGIPQGSDRHAGIDTGMHLLGALRHGATLTQDPAVSFAVLTHDLGKAATPGDLLPKHCGHEERSVEILEKFCTRLPVPRAFRDLAMHVARYHCLVHRAEALQPDAVLQLLIAVDAFRKPGRFEDFLLACEAVARGREGSEEASYPQAERLRLALRAALAVDTASLLRGGKLEGAAIGAAIGEQRLAAIREALTRRPD